MSKQTAVEWLMEELRKNGSGAVRTFVDLFEQAKAMEKEQHNNTWVNGWVECKYDNSICKEKTFEQYYNETYGNRTKNN